MLWLETLGPGIYVDVIWSIKPSKHCFRQSHPHEKSRVVWGQGGALRTLPCSSVCSWAVFVMWWHTLPSGCATAEGMCLICRVFGWISVGLHLNVCFSLKSLLVLFLQEWFWSLLETSAAETHCSLTMMKIPLSSMTRLGWTMRMMKTRMMTTSTTNICRKFEKENKKSKKRKLFVWSNCTFLGDSPGRYLIVLTAYGLLSVYHLFNSKKKNLNSWQTFMISLPL